MIRRPPRSTLFPYTRSSDLVTPRNARRIGSRHVTVPPLVRSCTALPDSPEIAGREPHVRSLPSDCVIREHREKHCEQRHRASPPRDLRVVSRPTGGVRLAPAYPHATLVNCSLSSA